MNVTIEINCDNDAIRESPDSAIPEVVQIIRKCADQIMALNETDRDLSVPSPRKSSAGIIRWLLRNSEGERVGEMRIVG